MLPTHVISVGTGLAEDCKLVHVPENRRAITGRRIAAVIDTAMREEAHNAGEQPYGKDLCPGCAMALVVNALLALAKANHWTIEYIRDHMNAALDDLVRLGATRADIAAIRKAGEEAAGLRHAD